MNCKKNDFAYTIYIRNAILNKNKYMKIYF